MQAGGSSRHAGDNNDKWAFYYVFCKGLADYRRGNIRAARRGALTQLVPRITGVSQALTVALPSGPGDGPSKAGRDESRAASIWRRLSKLLNQHMQPIVARFPTVAESHIPP